MGYPPPPPNTHTHTQWHTHAQTLATCPDLWLHYSKHWFAPTAGPSPHGRFLWGQCRAHQRSPPRTATHNDQHMVQLEDRVWKYVSCPVVCSTYFIPLLCLTGLCMVQQMEPEWTNSEITVLQFTWLSFHNKPALAFGPQCKQSKCSASVLAHTHTHLGKWDTNTSGSFRFRTKHSIAGLLEGNKNIYKKDHRHTGWARSLHTKSELEDVWMSHSQLQKLWPFPMKRVDLILFFITC